MMRGTIYQSSILHGRISYLLGGLSCLIAPLTTSVICDILRTTLRAHCCDQTTIPCSKLTSAVMLVTMKPNGGAPFCVLGMVGMRPPSIMVMFICHHGQSQQEMQDIPWSPIALRTSNQNRRRRAPLSSTCLVSVCTTAFMPSAQSPLLGYFTFHSLAGEKYPSRPQDKLLGPVLVACLFPFQIFSMNTTKCFPNT